MVCFRLWQAKEKAPHLAWQSKSHIVSFIASEAADTHTEPVLSASIHFPHMEAVLSLE